MMIAESLFQFGLEFAAAVLAIIAGARGLDARRSGGKRFFYVAMHVLFAAMLIGMLHNFNRCAA